MLTLELVGNGSRRSNESNEMERSRRISSRSTVHSVGRSARSVIPLICAMAIFCAVELIVSQRFARMNEKCEVLMRERNT